MEHILANGKQTYRVSQSVASRIVCCYSRNSTADLGKVLSVFTASIALELRVNTWNS